MCHFDFVNADSISKFETLDIEDLTYQTVMTFISSTSDHQVSPDSGLHVDD